MATSPHAVTVRTREIRPGDPLYDPALPELLPDGDVTSWIRDGEGLVGWGEVARVHTRGATRFDDADRWWQRLCTRAEVDDAVRLPGTGPVAFASFAFADHPGRSVVVVPHVVIGQRDGVRWITTVGDDTDDAESAPIRHPGTIRYSDGQVATTTHRETVGEAIRRMRGPDGPSKVVLAHDLLASTSRPLDTRFLLRNLTARHPNCWTFAVDGLVGATPELLLERDGSHVRSRVLAGTNWPQDGTDADRQAAQLLMSAKDQDEHRYAVESLATSLRPFCGELTAPETPEVLRLRNVMHLASDVSGRLDGLATANDAVTLLRLVGVVHPTAAVGGTPTGEAVRLIEELEGMDRQRYAGPVGWVDATGDGEFGIALRCAQTQEPDDTSRAASTVRLFAGGGIVTDSDPDEEVAEAQAKLLPMREALEGVE